MNLLTQSKNTTILPVLVALMLGCFGLSVQAGAVCQEGFLTNENTVLGEAALIHLTTGFWNTAIGRDALRNNTTGIGNSALGFNALQNNTDGGFNTATGQQALSSNTTGNNNITVGSNAGINLTTAITISISAMMDLQASPEPSVSVRNKLTEPHLSLASVEQAFQQEWQLS